jgi:hypothetical protein
MTGEICNHKWVHLDTYTHIKTYPHGYSCLYTKVDRFYCEHCLQTREIKKEECCLDKPEWYY